MKVFEILGNWDDTLKSTVKTVSEILKNEGIDNPNFMGGYCFHLALAVFMQKPGSIIIADGGHAAVFDPSIGKSIDVRGMHEDETALYQRRQRSWKTANGFIKAVSAGFSNESQIKALNAVYQHYK